MRCPDCNRFVSMETEVDDAVDVVWDSGAVSAEVRVTRNCADCGTELKSADFLLEDDLSEHFPECLDKEKGDKEGHDVEVETDGVDIIEVGGGRYAKSYYGAEVSFTAKCSCGHEYSSTMNNKVAASEMEESV